jgi:hypothetical protein
MKHLFLTGDQISDASTSCTPCIASSLHDELLGAVPQVPTDDPTQLQSAGRAKLFPPREITGGKSKNDDIHGHLSEFLSQD